MTARQWLTECKVHSGERSRVFDLPSPVHVVHVAEDDLTVTRRRCRTSTDLFALFFTPGIIVRCAWAGLQLGPHGLYELNYARFTGAVKVNGLNIVHHWLVNRPGMRTALGCDFAALLSFLEIRPVSRPSAVKKPANAIHYVQSTTGHKVGRKRDAKKRPHAQKTAQ